MYLLGKWRSYPHAICHCWFSGLMQATARRQRKLYIGSVPRSMLWRCCTDYFNYWNETILSNQNDHYRFVITLLSEREKILGVGSPNGREKLGFELDLKWQCIKIKLKKKFPSVSHLWQWKAIYVLVFSLSSMLHFHSPCPNLPQCYAYWNNLSR